LICAIHHQHAVSLIVVTHNPEVAASAGRTLRMLDGRIVSDTLNAGGAP
jgi:predicted ABC-type transport system involved in lysophospholipase L1 biosynthesis ATPase subunit